MTLPIPAQHVGFVRDKVKAGTYSTEVEVVCAALDLLMARDREVNKERARISRAIEAGCKQLREGKTRSLEEVLSRLEERKHRREANARPA